MQLLSESLDRTYKNGSRAFSIKRVKTDGGFLFLIEIESGVWVFPSFVPENVVNRQDLISIITEMSV